MKVKGGITQTQVVEGTISQSDLLALVRETFTIPENARARFFITAPPSLNLLMQSSSQLASPLVDVTASEPLHFRITWEVPVAPKQG